MRVLVVDQDSASNEAIVRSLREHYTVDAVTNKGDALDLLRSNTFEVLVAAERLEDGSGLELLGQIGKKWPSVLRIFAADRQRLQLLRGRLGPFELFQTLAYPIDPERLIATLDLATAAQDAHADTSNIQHVVLTAEPPPDVIDELEDTGEMEGGEESDPFPAPQPAARIAPRAHAIGLGARALGRIEPLPRPEPSFRTRPSAIQPRRVGGTGSARTSTSPGTVSRLPAPAGGTARHSGRLPRNARFSGANRASPPVRFPPLESPRDPAAARSNSSDPMGDAAELARAARDNYETSIGELDTRRIAIMIGGGATALLIAVVVGFKTFGSGPAQPHPPAPPAVQVPQYPAQVTELIAQIEAALKTDDFKTARSRLDSLRQIAPNHPRLAFFDGLLAQKADATRTAAANAAGKHSRKAQNRVDGLGQPAAGAGESAGTNTAMTHSQTVADAAPALAPETPVGLTRIPATASAAPVPATSSETVSRQEAAAGPLPGEAPAFNAVESPKSLALNAPAAPQAVETAPAIEPMAPAEAARTHVGAVPAPKRTSSEPPPVIREAKVIRRVDPDYPSAAKRDGVTGSVDLEVTVTEKGAVRDVSVVRASPAGVFDRAAVTAVRKWKYDPRYVDGLPAEAHLNVHLEFGPAR